MFRHPIVKPAFHISWFLLILGGISLFDKGKIGILGAAMFIAGLIMLAYTAVAIYLHKKVVNEPGWLLLISFALQMALVFVQVMNERYALGLIIFVISMPVFMGWIKIKGKKLD